MSDIYSVIDILNQHKCHFFLQQLRPKSITIFVTLVGCRLEVEAFDDGHIEIARFDGDESVESGADKLVSILKEMG